MNVTIDHVEFTTTPNSHNTRYECMTCHQSSARSTSHAWALSHAVTHSGEPVCEWFALCTNEATGSMTHPILGEVPICDRCRERVENM